MTATYPFEDIMCTGTYGFATISLTVHELAEHIVSGPASLHWNLASPTT